MTKIDINKNIKFSKENMFELVVDVEKYPEFLPSCQSLIINEKKMIDNCQIYKTYMTVGAKKINRGFSSQVIADEKNMKISIQSDDKIFKYMTSEWKFSEGENNNECNIHFTSQYEFRNRALAIVMGSVFEAMSKSMVNAFEKRAYDIYDE